MRKNTDAAKRARQRWYETHRDEQRQSWRNWAAAHPEQAYNHRVATVHVARAKHAGVDWEYIIPDAIYFRDGGRCGICGDTVDRVLPGDHPLSRNLDHIIPKSRGGPHLASNIQLAHRVCNARKGISLSA